jgi:hypothetical protein
MNPIRNTLTNLFFLLSVVTGADMIGDIFMVNVNKDYEKETS